MNLSSVAAPVPIPFQAYYSASKAAINDYTMALANEVRPYGVEVCCVQPGDIKTGFTAAREKVREGDDVYGGRIARSVGVMEHDEQTGMQTLLAANPEAVGTVQINLTRNLCDEGHGLSETIRQVVAAKTADDLFAGIASQITDPAMRREFSACFDREALLSGFQSGKTSRSMEQSVILAALSKQPTYTVYNRRRQAAVHLSGKPLRRMKHDVLYLDACRDTLVFLLTDVTAIFEQEREARERLETALLAAQQASSAKSNFLSRMCNAYLNALASMLESEFSVSLPNLKLGASRDILDTFLSKFRDETPELLFIENTFFYLDQAFVSYILLHPKFESLQRILEKLT